MNVASSELCRELYELSGWRFELAFYANRVDRADQVQGVANTYAYDLGYLLRKLPGIVELHRYANGLWSCDTDGFGYEQAKSPEDAVAKLTIELFKRHVLKKGSVQ